MDTPAKPDDLSDMGPSPFELELYRSLTNALNVLRGSAPSAIVWSIVRGLNPFPQNIALKVSKDAAWKLERNAVPRDFVELARQYHGVTKTDLLAQGRVAFSELVKLNNPQYDLICSNWRVVYAVKQEFETLQDLFFAVREEKSYWVKKRFAKRFASVDFTDEAKVAKEYFLEGFETYQELMPDGKRPINFLGNYKQCQWLLQQLGLSNTYQLPYVPKHQIVLALPASYYAKKQKPVAKPKVDPHGHKLLCEMVDSLNKEQSEQRS